MTIKEKACIIIVNKFIKLLKEVKMPKIIENAREKIIDEAKRQIKESGYENVTIRSIVRGCSLGLGTFYNYFKSKDMLIATFLLEDWNERMTRITLSTENEADPHEVIKCICDEIAQFIDSNKNIFNAPEAKKSFNNTVASYHKRLVSQLAAPIRKVCVLNGYENAEFLSLFIAESALTWTVAGKAYSDLSPIFNKLLIK